MGRKRITKIIVIVDVNKYNKRVKHNLYMIADINITGAVLLTVAYCIMLIGAYFMSETKADRSIAFWFLSVFYAMALHGSLKIDRKSVV